MNPCPQCGYEPSPTNRQALRFYKKHFGDLPVFEMIHRGWLPGGTANLPRSLPVIEKALFTFFEVKSKTELLEVFSDCFPPPTGLYFTAPQSPSD